MVMADASIASVYVDLVGQVKIALLARQSTTLVQALVVPGMENASRESVFVMMGGWEMLATRYHHAP